MRERVGPAPRLGQQSLYAQPQHRKTVLIAVLLADYHEARFGGQRSSKLVSSAPVAAARRARLRRTRCLRRIQGAAGRGPALIPIASE